MKGTFISNENRPSSFLIHVHWFHQVKHNFIIITLVLSIPFSPPYVKGFLPVQTSVMKDEGVFLRLVRTSKISIFSDSLISLVHPGRVHTTDISSYK